MKQYLTRSVKYLAQLVVLFSLIFLVMSLTGNLKTDFADMYINQRGMIMLLVIVLLAATYPLFGFVKKVVKADLTANRENIIKAFAMGDYAPVKEDANKIVFRNTNALKRLIALYEDEIIVSRDDNYIIISGLRKEVVKAEYRLKSFL